MFISKHIRYIGVGLLPMLPILCFTIIIGLSSCGRKHRQADIGGDLLLISDARIERLLNIDTLIEPESLQFAILENSRDSAFINNTEFRFSTDNELVFFNRMVNRLLLFSYDGKLKKELDLNALIGSDLKIADVRYNPYSKHIEILDMQNNFYPLSVEGELLAVQDQFKSYPLSLFFPLSDSVYILYNNFKINGGQEAPDRFYVLKDSIRTRSWWPIDTSLVVVLPISSRQFYRSSGSLHFFDPFFPVIYTVSDTGLKPKYRLQYQQFNLTTKDALDVNAIVKETKFHPVPAMSYFIESDHYCIMEYILGEHRYSSVYDKTANKCLGVAHFGLSLGKAGVTLYNPVFEKNAKDFLTVIDGEEVLASKENYSAFKSLGGLKNYDKVLVSFRFK